MKMSAVLFMILLGIVHVSGEICEKSVCEYNFNIAHDRTMVLQLGRFRTFNAMWNGTNVVLEQDEHDRPLPTGDVSDDIITADGVRRNIITVNGMYPGPPIEVMEGAQVVVHVTNDLLTQSVSLHWHGIHQRKTTWMDGTAFVSQCPILPQQSFTYRFIASPAGTHWYHDHFRRQRSDGLMGMLIVHKALPTLPEMSLVVSDWFHFDSTTAEITNYYNRQGGAGDNHYHYTDRSYSHDVVELSSYKYVSGLINGRGRFGGNKMPLSTTVLPAGQTTRFRVVNSGSEFQYELSVDQHQLQIIALDGQEIEPLTTDSFLIAPGERIDFLLTTDQSPDNYWVRCKTPKEGVSPDLIQDGIEQVVYGIIRYEGAADQDPTSVPRSCSSSDNCLVFNCPWERYPEFHNKKCILPSEAKSTMSQRELNEEYGLNDDEYEEYIFNFGYTFGASINSLAFVQPRLPFSEPNYQKGFASCETKQCQRMDKGCRCTQTIAIPFNKTIQMVFASYKPPRGGQFVIHAHHSIHMHGHNFAILRMGYPSLNATTGRVIEENPDVVCDTPACKRPRWNGPVPELNVDKPMIRDTLIVPAQGYYVLRFRSTNPGHWLLTCQIQNHIAGQSLVFSEAEEKIPAPPENFPTCHNFEWSESQFSQYIDQSNDRRSTDQPPAGSNDVEKPSHRRPYVAPGRSTTAHQPNEIISDESIPFTRNELIGLIIGCIAFGAVLMLVPYLCMLCKKSKYT